MSWKNIQGCLGWASAFNGFCRNSGAITGIGFALELTREWMWVVFLPAVVHPWMLLILFMTSMISGLGYLLQSFRELPIAVVDEINEVTPNMAEVSYIS